MSRSKSLAGWRWPSQSSRRVVATGLQCRRSPDSYADPRRIVDPEQVPETKRIRRLTADQFFASLRDRDRAALGRPRAVRRHPRPPRLRGGDRRRARDVGRIRQARGRRRAPDLPPRGRAGSATPPIPQLARDLAARRQPHGAARPVSTRASRDNLRYLVLRFHGLSRHRRRRSAPPALVHPSSRRPRCGRRRSASPRPRTDGSRSAPALALHPDFLTY